MLGHVLSRLKPKVGTERACWSQKGCFGELLVRLGVPRARLREALGSSRGALWSSLACFRDVSGSLLEAFADSEAASEAEKAKMLKLLYLSCENMLFEVSGAPEAPKNRPKVGRGGLSEALWSLRKWLRASWREWLRLKCLRSV